MTRVLRYFRGNGRGPSGLAVVLCALLPLLGRAGDFDWLAVAFTPPVSEAPDDDTDPPIEQSAKPGKLEFNSHRPSPTPIRHAAVRCEPWRAAGHSRAQVGDPRGPVDHFRNGLGCPFLC